MSYQFPLLLLLITIFNALFSTCTYTKQSNLKLYFFGQLKQQHSSINAVDNKNRPIQPVCYNAISTIHKAFFFSFLSKCVYPFTFDIKFILTKSRSPSMYPIIQGYNHNETWNKIMASISIAVKCVYNC